MYILTKEELRERIYDTLYNSKNITEKEKEEKAFQLGQDMKKYDNFYKVDSLNPYVGEHGYMDDEIGEKLFNLWQKGYVS